MDYKTQYKNLIKTRIDRKKIKGTYYEKHHIIPKCWGGCNKKENIIYLTAREHYIAHWLLYRLRPHSNGISFAFWKMTFPGGKFVERNYKITSRAYEEAKQAMAESNRRLNSGRKISKHHLKKWSKNKNNSKTIVNVATGEEFNNAKQLWRERYSTDIGYSAFNYYLRKKITNKRTINGKRLGGPRKLFNDEIYNWQYK